jgi:hypothetical protein
MAANSKHYRDVYLWLIKVIMNCETHDQHFNARAMVRRFQHGIIQTYNLPENAEQEIQTGLDIAIEKAFKLYLKNKRPDLVSPEDNPTKSMGDDWKSASPEEKKNWNLTHPSKGWTKPPPGEDDQPLSMGEKPVRPSIRTIPEWKI